MRVPPLWFLGIDQVVAGNQEPFAVRLASRGIAGIAGAAGAALLAYWWSYRRHRRRVLESPAVESAARSFWPEALAEHAMTSTRRLAIFVFIAKMLGRSRQHRLILTAFVAIAMAIIFEGFVSLAAGFRSSPQAAIAAPLALSLFVLTGLRYLFRLPVELRANWLFRIHEPGHGLDLLEGVEAFLMYFAVLPVAVLTLPIELRLLGAGAGLLAGLMCALPSLILVELLLFGFERIPFTSTYLPGQRPLIDTILGYSVSAVVYVFGMTVLIFACLRSAGATLGFIASFAAAWWWMRRIRLEWRPIGRLEFEELPEPVVQLLSIEKD